jgi:hypothetical protein
MSDSNVQYVICNLRSHHRPSRDKRVAESGRLRACRSWPPRDKLTSANHSAPPTPGPGPHGRLSRECVSRVAGSREEPEADEAGDPAVPNRTGIATAKWYHDTITLYTTVARMTRTLDHPVTVLMYVLCCSLKLPTPLPHDRPAAAHRRDTLRHHAHAAQ